MNELPQLISFPRTGSHWLRVLLEEYSGRPLKGRSFKWHWSRNYLLTHSHDNELNVHADKIIYLYREPVSTICSQLRYYDQSLDDIGAINYWTSRYGYHLLHWLVKNKGKKPTTQLNVSYSDLKQNPFKTFESICEILSLKYEEEKFKEIYIRTNKSKVKSLSTHDQKVVTITADDNKVKENFRLKNASHIHELIKQCAKNSGYDQSILDSYFKLP